MKEDNNIFRSSRLEYCHILNDRIVIANNDKIEDNDYLENKIDWFKACVQNFYILELIAIYFVFDNGMRHYENGDWSKLVAVLLIFAAVIFSVIYGRNKSKDTVIYKKNIRRVTYTTNNAFKTSAFRVFHTNAKGQEKVRMITVYYKEKENHELALNVFKNAGLYTDEKQILV